MSDELIGSIVPAIQPDVEFCRLWGCDEAPSYPDDGEMPAYSNFYAPLGGLRFGVFTLHPEGSHPADPSLDMQSAVADVERKLPGSAVYIDPEGRGMHVTPTIDCAVVLSGKVTLELDGGAVVILNSGDTLVQNGTRHRWRNLSSEPVRVAAFSMGANHHAVGA